MEDKKILSEEQQDSVSGGRHYARPQSETLASADKLALSDDDLIKAARSGLAGGNE